MKKNCKNCKHLQYYEAGYEGSCDSGFYCNKRNYASGKAENRHLDQLNDPVYLERGKKCCELRKD